MTLAFPLQGGMIEAVPSDPIAQLLIGVVILLIALFAVRFFLKVAWKLLFIAALILAVIYGFSILGIPMPI